jgi:hypothetical protein
MSSRARTVLVAVAIVTASLSLTACAAGGSGGGASASCAGSTLELTDPEVRAGGTVQLTLDGMHQVCEDTGGTFRPAEDVTVTITPASTGEPVLLGRPTPSGSAPYVVQGSFDLPEDLPTGDAVLSVRSHKGDRAGADLDVTVAPAA